MAFSSIRYLNSSFPSSELSTSLPMSFHSHLRELSYVRMHPIEGSHTRAVEPSTIKFNELSNSRLPRSNLVSQHVDGPAVPVANQVQNGANGQAQQNDSTKAGDFHYYSDSEEDEVETTKESGDRISCNFVDYTNARSLGLGGSGGSRFFGNHLSSEYATRHMLTNGMFKESLIYRPDINKVFCSTWLSHRQIVFGTKCNKLLVYDVNTRHMDQIPSLSSTDTSTQPDAECGIHAIEINPSRTLLATAAKISSDIAVYSLPTLDPVSVGEGAHTDWLFDVAWLDDRFLVSGGRDGSMGLWKITDEMVDQVNSDDIPSYSFMKPLVSKLCKTAERVRSLCFNRRRSELVALSSNGYIHCWDTIRFRQLMSKRLPHTSDNVCLAVDEESVMYAVGSKAHVDLLDARTLQGIRKLAGKSSANGVRSLSFKGNIFSIGTGSGTVLFYDLRAAKPLELSACTNRTVNFKASTGWLESNMFHPQDGNQKYSPAVYTHCFDSSGTRVFVAGGPLQCSMKGNYIALFQ